MPNENDIIKALSQIVDNNRNQDIVSLGFVNNIAVKGEKVSFNVRSEYQTQAEEAALAVDGVSVVKATPIAQSSAVQNPNESQNHLKNINSIIAVSSCKGGVGKSTIAANIAKELVNRGFKVGLLDADIYGPSIPTLLNIPNETLHANEKGQLIPLVRNNLKIISFGFLLGGAPAVMRGPIVTRYVQQLFFATDWGELDYLIVDMPPGTGDIHLTITQMVRLAGAVIVTTPHTLSLVDVARGILMFEKVSVPILGVIENMSYFEDPHQEKHYIFGESSADKLKERFGIDTLAEIPITPELGKLNDELKHNMHIQETVGHLLKREKERKSAEFKVPQIKFDSKEIHFVWDNGEEWSVNNRELRLISKDALSVNEVTGEQLINPEDLRQDLAAKEVTPLGNYAVGVAWNDGHSSAIYPYKDIKQIATVKK